MGFELELEPLEQPATAKMATGQNRTRSMKRIDLICMGWNFLPLPLVCYDASDFTPIVERIQTGVGCRAGAVFSAVRG